jgi:glycosyltransferase involved in cell wall biosynthesis
MPSVSVIIPTYNRAWSIKRAVDSVLEQTCRDFELIVVDDGSSDETPGLLEAYRGAIKWVRQENRGVSAARNRGVSESSAGLIAFLDSDDYWYPEKLAAQAAFFEAHPEALICQTQEIWIRKGRRVNSGLRHQKPDGDIFIPSLRLCLVSPSAVMLRKSLFLEAGGFDEALPACEDYDLWLRVSVRCPVHLVDQALLVKTGGHEDQLSRQPGLDRYRIESIWRIMRKGNLSPERFKAAKEVLREKSRVYAAGCRKRGRLEEAAYYEELGFGSLL